MKFKSFIPYKILVFGVLLFGLIKRFMHEEVC